MISTFQLQKNASKNRLLFIILATLCSTAAPSVAEPLSHAIAMHGKPALAADYKHFPYVNPQAPRGGRLTLGKLGSYDSLNPFIVRGVAPSGLRGLVYESLMARSADEPFTLYGLIARSIEVPVDRSWITFHIDPGAAFSDGKPITADDIIFSHDLLRRKGRPYLRSHYNKIRQAEKLGPKAIKFHFKAAGDREIPLIMGLMPILPKHAIDPETFEQTSLQPPIGSGPYVVAKVDPGHALLFRRNPKYWAANRPVRRGMHNFDELRMLYYRDASAVFEAFKTGAIDVRRETNPARWIDGYDFPAMRDGKVTRKTFKSGKPSGMTGLVFNTRRGKFSDIRVRQAFSLAFDGPGINQALFHGRFVRTESFFAGSELASTARQADERERQLLAPFKQSVLPEIMAGTWRLPTAATKKARRSSLKQAFSLLRAAGYELRGRKLVQRQTGRPLDVELLVTTTAQERIALSFSSALKRLGVTTTIRKVESSQYWARIGRFEFDMIQWHYSASLSPGNEQINRWASSHAAIERSLNYAGVKNPAVDAMIRELLEATERENFVSAVRAFDRALLSGTYLIPLFHTPEQWYAVWSHLRHPPAAPLLGTDLATWWQTKAK
ncbi:MAG: peptide/nickel transport system substrate-binding protein [Alphaproteobacteria bacterium]|jgi:peptide/nickel transport system substrate-binding protein